MGMDIQRVKNIYSVNATAFILDNTLSQEFHDSDLDLEYHERANNIWEFQLNLMSIIAFVMGSARYHNPTFITQFNERGGW